MKKQIVSIFAYSILGLSAVMVSCGGDTNKSKSADTENVASEMAFLRVDIEGMTCAVGCAKTIEKMLSETEGVTSAEVDYDKKAAFINYDKSKVSEAALLKSISEYKDGTYKAMVSTKSCKSDCKKACCAVAAAKKTVKKTVNKATEAVGNKTNKVINNVATKSNATREIVKGKVKETTASTISDLEKKVNTTGNSIKAKATTTVDGANRNVKDASKSINSKVLNTKKTVKTKTDKLKESNTKSIEVSKKTANKLLGR